MTTPRRRRRGAWTNLIFVPLLAAGVAGCSSAPSVEQVAVTEGPGPRATLAVAGDVHFEGSSASTADLGGAFSVLRDADASVVNLETPVSGRGQPAGKQYAFRAPPAAMTALADAGVDAVTVANNHGMDYGPVALTDTLSAGEAAGLAVLGAGQDSAQAFAPWRITPRGVRVSVLAATDVLDDDLAAAWTATADSPGLASAKAERGLLAAVRAEAADADVVVVFLHWGAEHVVCPTDRQQLLARELAAAGADVVVGSHAHVLQPTADVDGTLVAYGLGNFHFYSTQEPSTRTGVLTLTVSRDGVEDHVWTPAKIVDGRPELLGAPASAQRSQELGELCPSAARTASDR